MRTARMYVLLAVIGQAACSSGTRVKATEIDWDAERKKFREDHPPLPDGVPCLDHPMAHYWHVSSSWRDSRHPFVPKRHYAVDFPAPVGTPVLAVADGEVAAVGPVAPGEDAYVSVRFADGWTFAVHHLSRVDVETGRKVVRGERLGLSGGKVDAPGSGPWTTGPHLHFNLAFEKVYVDPRAYFCDPEP